MFASGIPLFLSESIKCYYSFPFWVKMTSLFLALVFTFTIRRRVTQSGVIFDRPLLGRVDRAHIAGVCGSAWRGADAGSGFRRVGEIARRGDRDWRGVAQFCPRDRTARSAMPVR